MVQAAGGHGDLLLMLCFTQGTLPSQYEDIYGHTPP